MLANKTRVRDTRRRPRKRAIEVRKAPGQARSKETANVIIEATARSLEFNGAGLHAHKSRTVQFHELLSPETKSNVALKLRMRLKVCHHWLSHEVRPAKYRGLDEHAYFDQGGTTPFVRA
jgi:hypothetical protein